MDFIYWNRGMKKITAKNIIAVKDTTSAVAKRKEFRFSEIRTQ